MKNKKILGFGVLLVIGTLAVSCAGLPFFSNPMNDIVGVYEGTYTAGQGETGLTLNIYLEGDIGKATFEFYNLPGNANAEEGKYYMSVTYDQGKYTLRGTEWIEQPFGYGFIDLQGTLSGNVFSGMDLSNTFPFRVVKREQ